MAESKTEKPDWVKMKPAELEKLVLELHKSGLSPEKIGLVLRDKHGIPKAKLLGKKMSQILKENKLKTLSEKSLVEKKVERLNRHIAQHKHDPSAQRSLAKKLWVIHKLERQEKSAAQ
jgi:small subunit ribosomal protein S15